MELPNYDAWLVAPYEKAQAEGERLECPECGARMEEDKAERSVDCGGCGYGNGYDWDAEAERRRDAARDDDH